MTRIQATLSLAKSIGRDHDVVILGLTTATTEDAIVGLPQESEKSYRKQFGLSVRALAKDLGASAEPGSVTVLPSAGHRLIVVGLGDPDVDPARIRTAVAAGIRAAAKLPGDASLRVAVSLELGNPELLKAAAEAAVLGAFVPERLTAEPKPARITAIDVVSPSARAEAKDAIAAAQVVAGAVCLTRDLVNLAPNVLFPESFVSQARTLLKDVKVDLEVLDEKALERGGYGGLTAVGGGSAHPPRLLRLEYSPKGAKTHICLVGKGITFDSGGLDIKPAVGMGTMKCDMAGAAAVLAATHAIAKLGLKVRVTTYAALAENMPSGSAYRPSDVLTIYGGTTVENYNTDAEGRLVMADALARSKSDNPDLVVDVATLTGAAVMALGARCAALMASDDETADLVLDAAEVAGEEFWQLPITDYARAELESPIADLRSGSLGKAGGALVAAAFLQRFIADGQAWAHLDIAGPAFNEGSAYGEVPAGGTGAGVRTLVALAQNLAEA